MALTLILFTIIEKNNNKYNKYMVNNDCQENLKVFIHLSFICFVYYSGEEICV